MLAFDLLVYWLLFSKNVLIVSALKNDLKSNTVGKVVQNKKKNIFFLESFKSQTPKFLVSDVGIFFIAFEIVCISVIYLTSYSWVKRKY